MNTPAGFRDFSPEEAELRRWMLSVIEEKFRLYGFKPLETPAVEFLDVLLAKSGEEIKEQIFVIQGEDIGLRFDLTVPMARFVAGKKELKKPFKRYAIGKVWRNEEPQKGRYREFIQTDADIVGIESPEAEVELLYLAKEILEEFGVKVEKDTVLLNDRAFMDEWAKKLGLRNKEEVFRIIDKRDKLPLDEIERLLAKAIPEKVESIMSLFTFSEEEALEEMEKLSPNSWERMVFIKDNFSFARITPYLVRGLDYYTGPIFEFKPTQDIGTVAAGGRYDNLIGIYGQPSPAVGISVGFERLYYLVKDRLSTPRRLRVAVYAFDGLFKEALSFSQSLRKRGVEVDFLYGKSLKASLDYASTEVRFFLLFAPREFSSGKVVLRDLMNSTQEELPLDLDVVYGVLREKYEREESFSEG